MLKKRTECLLLSAQLTHDFIPSLIFCFVQEGEGSGKRKAEDDEEMATKKAKKYVISDEEEEEEDDE